MRFVNGLHALFISPYIIDTSDFSLRPFLFRFIPALVALILVFWVRRGIFKTLFGTLSLYGLCFAGKLVFGSRSFITVILCWLATAALCYFTVSFVNRVNWQDLRGRHQQR